MYSKIKNIQIIVSLLKAHGVRNIVLSAGTRHVPLAHSVENDDYFNCYSVVDERSAGYYALGLAKKTGEPVAIACTSSTATCNYTPPIAEAYYQHIPLVVLTGDRHRYLLDQLEDQMIDQVDMYSNFCRKCVTLPVVKDAMDEWYCQRLVNEALLEMDHHGKGPVQINFAINQSIQDIADASVPELPPVNVIRRHEEGRGMDGWEACAKRLKAAKRVLVLAGSSNPLDAATQKAIDAFAERYNCVIATEHISNVHCKNQRNTYLMVEATSVKVIEAIMPDIVISFGDNFISRWKALLKARCGQFEYWSVNEAGAVCDPLKSLNEIFECTPGYFFDYFAGQAAGSKNDGAYLAMFDQIIGSIKQPPLKYSNMMAINKLSKAIPNGSLLHLSILNSVRLMQFQELDPSIECYSNVGTFGIDGCMSTFLGQSRTTDQPAFLVVGDLSFFYDMNSVMLRNIRPNVHIMLVNNEGAAEFHFTMGRERLPRIDDHIAAGHHRHAREWVEANGFAYLSASNEEELEAAMKRFTTEDFGAPVFLEVFTDKEEDGLNLRAFRSAIHIAKPENIELVPPPTVAEKATAAAEHAAGGMARKLKGVARKVLK